MVGGTMYDDMGTLLVTYPTTTAPIPTLDDDLEQSANGICTGIKVVKITLFHFFIEAFYRRKQDANHQIRCRDCRPKISSRNVIHYEAW
jgi:hypothetical protein